MTSQKYLEVISLAIRLGNMEDDENTLVMKEFNIHEIPLSCTWIIIGPPGSGKCLAPGTFVMMANGSTKPVEKIQIDDEVMGVGGDPKVVVGLCYGTDQMYIIHQEYGTDYTTNSKHILVLQNDNHEIEHISAENAYTRQSMGETFKSVYSCNFNDQTFPDRLNKATELLSRGFLNGKERVIRGLSESDIGILRSVGMRCKVCGDTTFINLAGRESVSITKGNPEGEYFGFELDGNDGRFLLADHTLTHNTTFIENMTYHLKHKYPVCRSFIGTEGAYKTFCKITHPLYVSLGYSEEAENKHIARQKLMDQENGTSNPCNYAINIIDDASDDTKIYKTKTMKGLFKLGSQHWHQLLMLGTQYAIDMPPDIRKSVSYVAIFMEPEEIERKKIYTNFGGLAGSYDDFCAMMDQVTGDYTCLIFKKRTQSNKRKDNIFWYKTKKLGDWKFGCQEYREWGEKRYNTNYIEKIM